MNKAIIILLVLVIGGQQVNAKSALDRDKFNSLEEKCIIIQNKQAHYDHELRELSEKLKKANNKVQNLSNNVEQNNQQIQGVLLYERHLADSINVLSGKFNGIEHNLGNKIYLTDNRVKANSNLLEKYAIWGSLIIVIFLLAIIAVVYCLVKRIKSKDTSIDEVRKAQNALQAAQTKMQEESIKLDNQLLAIVQKQLDSSVPSANKATGEPDHSLVVKLADEIARIETNLSKMDKSVRGYKQLVQAKDRMINNVRANGYEIISLLGREYNDGMQFQTRFVPDESLPEGKRIITGMIKMQVNYNGKMIQPAEIVVSQNI